MMKARKRNREFHTKPGSQEQLVPIHLLLPRASVMELKDLERKSRYTKEEIFLAGMAKCEDL